MPKDTIFSIPDAAEFKERALQLFYRQAEDCKIYREFLDALGRSPKSVSKIEEIPFLPISFFKSHVVKTGSFNPEEIFTSSGTTGQQPSQHFVKDLSIYRQSFTHGFQHFYGSIENTCVLALLPAYLERKGSSLVFMANDFIKKSEHPQSGFYLNELEKLSDVLQHLAVKKQRTLLLGVSFALLDLAEKMPENFDHKNLIVMETGGMKGRRKELIRSALHAQLKAGFQQAEIHSEYGMTELLSQAYAKREGRFFTPPWMKLMVRETTDPLSLAKPGKTGGINVIDLANEHSCAFIATEDLGRQNIDGSIEILGRFDLAEIRGCNLMVE